jgi:YD repeat-containing protein
LLGNLWKTVGTKQDTTTIEESWSGHPKTIWTPTDSGGGPSTWTKQVLALDVMGRVLRDSSVAAPRIWNITSEASLSLVDTAPARIAMVVNTYDLEGRPLSVSRYTPVLNPGESFLMSSSTASSWTYDPAGRVRTATTSAGTETHYYDPASNVIRTTTRRGLNVTQQYDAVGRVIARTTPEVRLTQFSCVECSVNPGLNPYPTRFPYFGTRLSDNAISPDAVIETETAFFSYDHAGRMVQADNPYALVRRGYYPNGALKADTSIARVYDQQAATLFPSTFQSVLTYTYDLSGRRISRADNWGGLQTYAYDALGQLKSSADRATASSDSVKVHYVYNRRGLLDSLTVPSAGVRSAWTYDPSGAPLTRLEVTDGWLLRCLHLRRAREACHGERPSALCWWRHRTVRVRLRWIRAPGGIRFRRWSGADDRRNGGRRPRLRPFETQQPSQRLLGYREAE